MSITVAGPLVHRLHRNRGGTLPERPGTRAAMSRNGEQAVRPPARSISSRQPTRSGGSLADRPDSLAPILPTPLSFARLWRVVIREGAR